jgi:NAD(P)H-quinone oxidoreductase subunit 4
MLSLLIWLPLVGAILIGFYPKLTAARSLALAIAGLNLLITLFIFSRFDLSVSGLQMEEYFPWIDRIGLSYRLGIDGISLSLLGLNSFLSLIVIYGSKLEIERSRLYYALILVVSSVVAGAFVSQNLLLFVLFFELELIPLYLLIAIWGGEQRTKAAMKFLIYTAISGLLILLGFFGIAWLSGANGFDYDTNLKAISSIPLSTQIILLSILVVGFGIKTPLVPLHTWLPDVYVESSPTVAILLGGVLAKLGTYGLVRFGLQLLPDAWHALSPILGIIGTVSVLYGALTAIAQTDIKRMVAYSSIGHMGYVLVALAAGTKLSLIGAIGQMVSHGLILAVLFYLVGVIETKVGTRDLNALNGLLNPIRGLPLTSTLLIVGGMASAGIPGLVGFIAEFLVFQGSFTVFPIPTLLCITASGLTAVYFVILLNRTCFGKLDNATAYYPKVTWTEHTPALILVALIFFLGIQPAWLLKWSEPTTNSLVASLVESSDRQVVQVAVKFDSSTSKNLPR